MAGVVKARRRREIADYLRALADRLELRDWVVRFVDEPSDEGTLAQVTVVYGRRWLDVQVCAKFLDLPADEQRQALAHELIHAHLDAIEGVMRDARAAHAVPRRVGALIVEAQHRAIEHAVDALADVVAPHLPLPPWAKQ